MDPNEFDWPQTMDPRIRLRKDRLAFFLISVSLAVTALYLGLVTLAMLSMDRALGRLVSHPQLELILGLPLLIAHLFAAILFMGQSSDEGRGPRVALILLITFIMCGFWGAEHARWLGFDEQLSPSSDDPVRTLLLRTLSLVRLLLLVDLAVIAVQPGSRLELMGLRRGVILSSMIGFGLWLLMSIEHIDWGAWPLRWRGLRDLGWFLILMVSFASRALSCFLATILCVKACSSRGQELAAMEATAKEDDPFGPLHDWNR